MAARCVRTRSVATLTRSPPFGQVLKIAAGKAGEHCLRRAPSLQLLRDGAALMKKVQGSRRMAFEAPEGGPLYVKVLNATSQSRTDQALFEQYEAGDVQGSGLTPTCELATAKLAHLLAAHSLKAQYAAVTEGIPGADAAAAAALTAAKQQPVFADAKLVDEAAERQLIATMALIMGTQFFLTTRQELPTLKKGEPDLPFETACLRLEEAGLGYYFNVDGYGQGTQLKAAMVAVLAQGFVKKIGGSVSFFLKNKTYAGDECTSALAALHLSGRIDYDALLYKVELPATPRMAKDKCLRFFTFLCSLAVCADRLDLLYNPGAIRNAGLRMYKFSGGVISTVLAAGSDRARSATPDAAKCVALKAAMADANLLKEMHQAMMQMAIVNGWRLQPLDSHTNLLVATCVFVFVRRQLAKKASAPEKYRNVSLLDEISIPPPPEPPKRARLATAVGTDLLQFAHNDDDDDDFQ